MILEKLIKITNRCQVLTSRGLCIGPINYPYIEKVSYILPMISKGASVVEVLPNGEEVVLSKFNFDRDNSIVVEEATQQENPEKIREAVMMGSPVLKDTNPGPNHNQGQNNNKPKNFNNNNNNYKNQGKKNNFNNNKQQQKPDVIINEKEVIHNNPKQVKADDVEEA